MILAVLLSAAIQSPENKPPVVRDPRAAKATEQPAVAPTAHLLPVRPPIHRIADRPSELSCSPTHWATARTGIDRGLAYLRTAQSSDGSWMASRPAAGTDQKQPSLAASTAVTALGLKAMAQAGHTPLTDASAKRAREFVRSRLDRSGEPFNPDPEGGLGNYVASAVASGLAAVDDPADRPLIETTIEWLTRTQWDQGEGISPRLDWFGGSGYGKWGRPDLSNTQMMLDALHDAGVSPEDPAMERALVFLTRTQNAPGTNQAAWAQAGTGDGGFVYTPANGGESFSSEAAGEGRYGEKVPAGQPHSLRSYGSMTYAGFKSLLYAGLSPSDPRVRAALDWIRTHWTFAENPGVGQQGYYYYVHALARALAASGLEEIVDAAGVHHKWRSELIEALASRQRGDGSWVNAAERWEESSPELCTIYATLALEEALKPSNAPAPSPTPRPAP